MEAARKAAGDKSRLKELVAKSTEKLKGLMSDSTEVNGLKTKLSTLISMVKAHISGKYRAFSNSSLLLVVFALVYFITPVDAIPDFVPAIGFTDDASVLYLIYRKLSKDIERYLEWSQNPEKEK